MGFICPDCKKDFGTNKEWFEDHRMVHQYLKTPVKKIIVRVEEEKATLKSISKNIRGFSELCEKNKEDLNKDDFDIPVLTQIAVGAQAAAAKAADLINVSADATIVLTDTAAVYARGDVIILAKVEQTGTIIDTAGLLGVSVSVSAMNAVNVKVSHASVDIAGKVYAGVTNLDAIAADRNTPAEMNQEKEGAVQIDAQASISMGYDMLGMPADKGLALAVSVADADASVNIQKGAVIEAVKDVSIASKSELKAATRADSGTFGAPFAVAVAVLVNDSHVSVDGSVTSKNGNVKISADGSLEAQTVADKGDGQNSLSGAYGAVTVALQDVKAEAGQNAVVNAKGSVQMLSNAAEKVKDHAASSPVKEENPLAGAMESIIDSVLGPVKKALTEGLRFERLFRFQGRERFRRIQQRQRRPGGSARPYHPDRVQLPQGRR